MKKNTIGALVLTFGLFAITSCTEDNKKNDTKKADKEIKEASADVSDATLEYEMSLEDDFMLPSVMKIAGIFESAGLEYAPGLTSPVDNADKYTSKFSKMLNFGVYSADLAYCSLNGQAQEAKNYMGAVQTLAKATGLGPMLENETLITRFNDNIGVKDSIRSILADVQEKTSTYMDDPALKGVSSIHYAGAWLEGMFLGANDVRNKNNDDIAVILIDQMTLLKNIRKGLNTYPGEHKEMDQLKNTFGQNWQATLNQEVEFELAKQALNNYLETNYKKNQGAYLYDFFYDNCATKIRDAVEVTYDNNFTYNLPKDYQEQTFRQLKDDNLH